MKKKQIRKIENLVNGLGAKEAIKRLSGVCPIGSGAASGYAGREAGGEPEDVEARSVESPRVTTGEASAFCVLMRATNEIEDLANYQRERERKSWRLGVKINARLRAEDLESLREDLLSLIMQPKPDSEARNERSGRRNAKSQQRT